MLRSFQNKHPQSLATYLDPSAVIIGEVKIAAGCSIWPLVVIRADVAPVNIGENTNIQDGTIIHVSGPSPSHPKGFSTTIGHHVTVGHRALIHGCHIEDHCLIGMGAIILDGAHIGEGSLIGAGTLIPPGKKIPPRSLVMGVPGKVIRQVSEEEFSSFLKSATKYAELAKHYRDDE